MVALNIAGAFDRVWHKGLLAKLQARGVQGDLLNLIKNYLEDRSLSVVVGGQESRQYPVRASVPQGSVLGPIFWNIFIDDLLQQQPDVSAYADDCTLSCSYNRDDCLQVAAQINTTLQAIKDWGTLWQVNFAPEKTQSAIISRSPAATAAMEGQLKMGDATIPLQNHVSILGVDFDEGLRFDRHINRVCRVASLKVTALRRMASFLDAKGLMLLYKAQVRPHLEYAALSWMSAAPLHLKKLDKIQRRALRLVQDAPTFPHLDSLEHRRDVGALTVLHKALVQEVPHLANLRLPPRAETRSTRTVLSSQHLVEVPRSRARQHLRTFPARAARLWNQFTATSNVMVMSTQQVKTAAHRWRATQPTPMASLYMYST